MVVAKTWLLEWVITAGCAMLGTINMARDQGDEILFGFKIRPIPAEVSP